MHAKQLWNSVPASSKLVWDRITFSRLTIAYFAFSLVHFAIQLSLQIKAFTTNADAFTFLHNIVVKGNAVSDSLPTLRGNDLYMCSWVPSDLKLDGCHVVWNGTESIHTINTEAEENSSSTPSSIAARSSETAISSASISTSVTAPISTSLLPSSTFGLATWTSAAVSTPIASVVPSTVTVFVKPVATSPSIISNGDNADDDDDDDERRELFTRNIPRILAFEQGGQTNVNISGMGFEETDVTLNSTCVWALNWPVSVLHDTIREDIVFIAFQFWVVGMSIVALLNESIPHILASLVTHLMATTWAAFQIGHTADFKSDFTRVITDGACDGVSLLPTYWHDRGIAELTSLAFNILAFLISSFLTWKLFRSFGWQTFKRVGASLTINRIYKIVLTLSITIQISVFFMAVTVSLWIDQLFNSAIGDLADFETLYKVSSFITLVLLVPWLMTGWFAVRRELRVPMFIFLVLSILYLGGWSVMFFSTTFRWSFVTWRFFSIMATASVILTVVSLVLGVVCRYNFGKGLLRYLNAQQNLPDGDFHYYEGSDEEKVDFPSNEKPVPTFAGVYSPGPTLSRPNVAQGPRFFNSSATPFETGRTSPVTPPPVYTIARKVSNSSLKTGGGDTRVQVMRSDTCSSGTSFGSLASYYMYNDRSHSRSDSQKRWIIE